MHVLVSTTATQGESPGDFCHVPEGELVGRYGLLCDDEGPDGSGCGCGRSFAGFVTQRATSTAMVVDLELTRTEWRAAVFRILAETGYGEFLTAEELAGEVDDIEAEDLDPVQHLPVGAVLGRCAWNIPRVVPRHEVLTMHDHFVFRRLPEVTDA